jgi:cytochrome c oxidase subunit 2
MAGPVDGLVLFMLASSTLITLAIFVCIVVFAIRYRRRPGNETGARVQGGTKLEVVWTIVPLLLSFLPFGWGAVLYVQQAQPPDNALEIYVVAKQWMWETQHPEGQAELNALHIPTGQPVKLTMTSQDVIHSFYVPAFRLKSDVLPGRYTTLWFEATEPGDFDLYCAEYCGTNHSAMLGRVIAMAPADFAEWLNSGATATNSPAAQGMKLFQQYGCAECHLANRAPNLAGVYGQPVLLQDGTTVVADANYLRESIVNPSARIVAGYQPIMPAFAGRLSEGEIVNLIEWIKSLGPAPGGAAPPPLTPSIVPGAALSATSTAQPASGGTTP